VTENNDRDTPRIFVPKGYVVFDLEITDPEGYEAYRLDGQATTRAFGGRVLSGEPAPRGIVEQLEGDWPTKRFVINEFPTVEIARAWFHSDTYAVTRAHFLDRASLALDQADPLGDEDRLAGRVGVPRGAGSRREVHDPAHDPRGRRRHAHNVNVHIPGEPVAGAGHRVEPVLGDLHFVLRCW
jgi:uncharacterized protein (DUF1330 family)